MSSLTYDPAREDEIDLEEIRARYRAMNHRELLTSGEAAAYMASPNASYGPTRPIWRVHLAEARAEWRRRTISAWCLCHGRAGWLQVGDALHFYRVHCLRRQHNHLFGT
jgi:hypothetical protein